MNSPHVVPLTRTVLPAFLLALVLLAAGCNGVLPGVQPTRTPSMSPIDVVYRNVEAMNNEDIPAYMQMVHPQAPGYADTEALLVELFDLYDLSTTLADVRIESETADEVQVYALMTTRKLRGPDFNNNRIDAVFILRKHQGEWRLINQNVLQVELPR